MHEGAGRRNGGVGFGIEGLSGRIAAEAGGLITLKDVRSHRLTDNEVLAFESAITEIAEKRNWSKGASLEISGDLLPHVGLGSGTAFRLAAIEALSLINEDPLEREVLVTHSGRGGTSGIGINTYFDGGFYLDLGIPETGGPFGPSSQNTPEVAPKAIPRLSLPDWPLIACLPQAVSPKTQDEEIDFFNRVAPLPQSASYEAAYIALFGLYASAMDGDYDRFCAAVNRMQETRWKAAEIAEYGTPIVDLMERLHAIGADCVGLSSLGPMVFAFVRAEKTQSLAEAARAMNCTVYSARPNQRGRRITAT